MSKNKQSGQIPHAHHPQKGQRHKNAKIDQNHKQPDPTELKITGIVISIDTSPHYTVNDTLRESEPLNLSIPLKDSDKELFRVVTVKCEDIVFSDTEMFEVNTHESNLCSCVFNDTIMPTKEDVEKKAYFIYLEQGGQPGHDLENWAKAEAQLTLHPE
jgi:hypothetical protein